LTDLESQNNEEQLLERLRRGQENAFSVLYGRFHQRVLYFARRYVNEAEAQDITAEAFVQLWKKRTGFDDIKSVSAFLFVTARNRCYNFLRNHDYRKAQEPALIEHLERTTAAALKAEEVRLQLAELLSAEIDKLPAKMREVFLLSFRDGLKPAQIAERLQITVKTVSNQKLSAIHLLRAAVAGHQLEAILIVLLQLELNNIPLFV
jgi:RNA polymerase sigma-70 factor (family 1)